MNSGQKVTETINEMKMAEKVRFVLASTVIRVFEGKWKLDGRLERLNGKIESDEKSWREERG